MYGQVAQSVEQRTENPRVGCSIHPLATFQSISYAMLLSLSIYIHQCVVSNAVSYRKGLFGQQRQTCLRVNFGWCFGTPP